MKRNIKNTSAQRYTTGNSVLLLGFSLALLLAGMGCKKTYNYSLDQTVSAVTTLFTPEDSFYVKLQPATGASVVFEWAEAQAADGSLVQYEIAFDTAGDNFKHPVFKIASDGVGVDNQATLTHSQLNQIANLAGIPSLGTGNLYWTVYSTKGLNEVSATQTRMITVTRPAGFANIPADVYLTGSATEGGTTLSNALPMKQTANGVFELYTSLTSGGTYQFVDRIAGTPITFYINSQGLSQTGSTTWSDTTAQVRFNLDFNNATGTVTVIRSIGVWFSQYDAVTYVLTYAGNSIWQDDGQLIQLPVVSYGLEDRYKFTFTVNYGGGVPDSYETYGSSNSNNNEPTSTTPASYWYLFPVTNDQWDYTFKFSASLNNNVKNNIILYMQAGAPYTHSVLPQ